MSEYKDTFQRTPSQFQNRPNTIPDVMKTPTSFEPIPTTIDYAAKVQADIEWQEYLDEIVSEAGILKEEPQQSNWFAELLFSFKIGKR